MHNDELDSLLRTSSEDEITPSSGFAASVMEAVRSEAALPSPIKFPWLRALPGMLAVVLAAGVGTYLVATQAAGAAASPAWLNWQDALARAPVAGLGTAMIWSCSALLFSYLSVKLSMRFATRRA